ncbi:MAG: hypothetical protein M1820_002019 [Bogoriella megaspora]|nr:MAG: hypothetical protein M1820_002019 [Bogoriella megaspora]
MRYLQYSYGIKITALPANKVASLQCTNCEVNPAHRIRRVKCDEERPICRRCKTTDRVCDGYAPIPFKKFHKKSSRTASPNNAEASPREAVGRSKPPRLPPEASIPDNESMAFNEWRSFEYFRRRTVPQLSGFFDASFWDYHILQTVRHEPAIRHSIIALGSLHERFEAGDPWISRSNINKVEGGFALEQYVKAIRCLVELMSVKGKQAVDVLITACVLFTCFEALRGHHGSALSHVKNGINMLREGFQPNLSASTLKCNRPIVPFATLQTLFARLDCQCIRLGADNGPIDYISPSLGAESGFSGTIPYQFSSLEEARNSLEYLERHWQYFSRHMEWEYPQNLTFDVERQRQLDNFISWYNTLERFLRENCNRLSAVNLQATRVLRARYLVTADKLSVSEPWNEMAWDEHINLYTQITELVADIVANPNRLNEKIVPSFSLDNGVAGPLFHVVRRCRDPTIRRKAIELWRVTPRLEGVWDGVLAFKVGERMMQLEEEGLHDLNTSKDIPREARIVSLWIKMHAHERRIDLAFTKRRDLSIVMKERPHELISETLTW